MLNIKDTYFNFASSQKVADIKKKATLDKLLNYDNYGVLSRKEFIFKALQDDYKPIKTENYTYYSSRLNDWTKPKTLYTMENEEGLSYEVTKTEYDYALHLINNGYIDIEKAKQFIDQEQEEKEQQARLQAKKEERERQERELQQQKEDQERKECLERKQKEWYTIGEQLLSNFNNNPITAVLDEHWAEIKNIYVNEEKEKFYDSMQNKFTIMLGNQNYCIHHLQYYIGNESDPYGSKYTIKNNPSMTLEKDVLFKVFSNLSLEDKPITITAKVKALYENREYKGGKEIKQHKFYYIEVDPDTRIKKFKEAYGQKLNIEGIICYLQTMNDDRYRIIEARTGMSLGHTESSKKKAVDKAKEGVKSNIDRIESMINHTLKINGISPLFQEQEAI